MVITHNAETYKVKAVQSTVCPAGSAYWLIQVHPIHNYRFDGEKMSGDTDDMAIVTIDTGAIYGSPTLAHYIDRIHTELDVVLAKLSK
jgi:hypothetical protein